MLKNFIKKIKQNCKRKNLDNNQNKKTEVGCAVCKHVTEEGMPILYLDTSGTYLQMSCGGENHTVEGLILVGVNHLIDLDPSTKVILKMIKNSYADRSTRDEKWNFYRIIDEDEDEKDD